MFARRKRGQSAPEALRIPGNAARGPGAVGSLGMPAMTKSRSRPWRLAAIPAVLLLCLAGLAACGTAVRPADVSANSFGDNARGTVVFWARSDTITAAAPLVKEFNATHSRLKVVMDPIQDTQAVTELATAIRGHAAPDLVDLNDIYMPIFTQLDAFYNLSSVVRKLPYSRALSPGHLALATYDKRIYGVPYLADLSVLWINKTLFKRAGLSPAKPPRNFRQILSDARKINALGHGISGFSFAGDCPGCLGFTTLPNIWAAGSNVIRGPVDNQTGEVAGNAAVSSLLKLYRALWREHLAPASDLTDTGATWGDDFTAGKVGIFPAGYGTLIVKVPPAKRSQFTDVALPGPAGGYATFDGGDDLAIPAGAKNASGAWEFMKWVLQIRQQDKLPAFGYTPVRSDTLTPAFERANPLDVVALKALAHGVAPATTAYNSIFNQAGGPWLSMFDTAVFNGRVVSAMATAQQGFNQLLKDEAS
jgi:multiple sugar transport system substrate-binding protein